MTAHNIIALILSCLSIFVISCDTNHISINQGVYVVNKDSLSKSFHQNGGVISSSSEEFVNRTLREAIIELQIKEDSIKGIIALEGITTLIKSQIIERNDSLVITTNESEAFIVPTKKGLIYMTYYPNVSIKLDKTDKVNLSQNALKAIKEKEEFMQNLGTWQKDYFIDEFGDKTENGFAYSFLKGSSENTLMEIKNKVYVKAIVEKDRLYFAVYDTTLIYNEIFSPYKKTASMKLKFPDGNILSEKVTFKDNYVLESYNNPLLYNFISQNEGVVKVIIDREDRDINIFHRDKYQFEIEKKNLLAIIDTIN